VKIRAGWDSQTINAAQVTQIAERAGAKAITIHGRTRQQAYKGPANWDYIRECKEVAKDILVIGNGDVFSAESALQMFNHTQCDAVLVSRGTMGQPWIVEDILRALSGLPGLERTVQDVKRALLEHFELIIKYQPEKQSLLDMRRVGCWYLKQCEGVRALRMQLNQCTSTRDVLRLIEEFSWEETSLNQKPLFAESEG
jgi:nifR3 family TIM-barrel protein